jgi:hypothetical protein
MISEGRACSDLWFSFGTVGGVFCVGSSGANVLSLDWILAVEAPLKKTFEVWIYARGFFF